MDYLRELDHRYLACRIIARDVNFAGNNIGIRDMIDINMILLTNWYITYFGHPYKFLVDIV